VSLYEVRVLLKMCFGPIADLLRIKLLEPSCSGGWDKHIAGASRLIHLRGPQAFSTRLEKEILLCLSCALVSPCVYDLVVDVLTSTKIYDSYRNPEQPFLEEEGWDQALASIASPDEQLSTRSDSAIDAWKWVAKLGRFCSGVYAAVLGEVTPSQDDIDALYTSIQEYREENVLRRSELDRPPLPTNPAWREAGLLCSDIDMREQTQASYYNQAMLCSRLLTALSSRNLEAIEEEAVTYCQVLVNRTTKTVKPDGCAGYWFEQDVTFPISILNTSKQWLSAARQPNGLIDGQMLLAWCQGRTDPTVLTLWN
jgi:hypothetical protein